jgi:hypothetical protein
MVGRSPRIGDHEEAAVGCPLTSRCTMSKLTRSGHSVLSGLLFFANKEDRDYARQVLARISARHG